jgi:hypothetical protein
MSEIISTITLQPITATFVATVNDIVITPTTTELNITTYGGGVPKALDANIANVHIYQGNNGQYLQTDGLGNLVWADGSGSGNGEVGGISTQVQFNDGGNFAGNVGFTFDKTSGNLAIPNKVSANNANIGNVLITSNGISTPGYYGDITGGNLFSAYTMNASIAINTANLIANIVTANYVITSNIVGNVSATGNISANNITATNTISASNVTATTSIGYPIGSGGTVTQTVNRGNPVTLNKPTGQITLFANSMSAQSQQSFLVTNSYVSNNDMIVVQHLNTSLSTSPYVFSTLPQAGSFYIVIRNTSNAATGVQSPILQFMTFKSQVS